MMNEMVLVLFVSVFCLVKMFIEKFQEERPRVQVQTVQESSVTYFNDLTHNDIKHILGDYLYTEYDEEEEVEEDLEEIKARFKQRHDKQDEEEYILRPVIDRSDNLFSFDPAGHEELERRNRAEAERSKKYRELDFFNNFIAKQHIFT